MGTIRILIVDDSTVLRVALRNYLERESGILVVGEAGDGATALELALELRPDLVLADFSMPGPSGIEIAAILKRNLPDTRVLVLSAYDEAPLADSALAAGAAAFVSKRWIESQLVPAIRQAVGSRTGLPRPLRH